MQNDGGGDIYRASPRVITNNEEEEDDDDGTSITARSEVVTSSTSSSADLPGRLRGRQMALRRKRSLSVADIPVPAGFEDEGNKKNVGSAGGGCVAKGKDVQRRHRAEESGYDSDATRKSSPRGSMKSDPAKVAATIAAAPDKDVAANRERKGSEETEGEEDSMSSKSDDSGNVSGGSNNSSKKKADDGKSAAGNTAMTATAAAAATATTATTTRTKLEPAIKKPPRKSKLPEATFRIGGQIKDQPPPMSRRFKKNGESAEEVPPERRHSESSSSTSSSSTSSSAREACLPLDFAENLPHGLPSLSSKRFRMLRLRRDPVAAGAKVPHGGELGIVISKKRHPQKGTTGYIIAHIDEDGLVER